MDPQILSSIVATIVGYLVGFLTKTGEGFAKKAGEDLFTIVKSKMQKNPSGQEAFQDFQQNPNDPDYQAALRIQIKKQMEKDEEWADQIYELLKSIEDSKKIQLTKQEARDNAIQVGEVKGELTINQSKNAIVNIGSESQIFGDIIASVDDDRDSNEISKGE
jgi:hypothetical protein